jgi:SAM-dependent methyltransferase
VDWGSGTGRLSFALAAEFAEVHAFDVSPGMLATARARAVQRGIHNVHFHHLDEEMAPLEADFALSLIVLQHLEKREHVRAGIQSLLGHLKSGGHAVVEIPDLILTLSSRLQPRFHLYRFARRLGIPAARLYTAGLHGMSVLAVPEKEARRLMSECGGNVLSVAKHQDSNYRYVRYLVQKV